MRCLPSTGERPRPVYGHGMIREAFALLPTRRADVWRRVSLAQTTASAACAGFRVGAGATQRGRGSREGHEPEPMDSADAGEERVRVTAVAYEHGPSLPYTIIACST